VLVAVACALFGAGVAVCLTVLVASLPAVAALVLWIMAVCLLLVGVGMASSLWWGVPLGSYRVPDANPRAEPPTATPSDPTPGVWIAARTLDTRGLITGPNVEIHSDALANDGVIRSPSKPLDPQHVALRQCLENARIQGRQLLAAGPPFDRTWLLQTVNLITESLGVLEATDLVEHVPGPGQSVTPDVIEVCLSRLGGLLARLDSLWIRTSWHP